MYYFHRLSLIAFQAYLFSPHDLLTSKGKNTCKLVVFLFLSKLFCRFSSTASVAIVWEPFQLNHLRQPSKSVNRPKRFETCSLWYGLEHLASPKGLAMNTTGKTCFFFEGRHVNFDKSQEVFIANIVTCILNFLLSLMTFGGNFLIVFAIGKTKDLHSPSFVLLGCLAVSDLLVGLICQPLFVAHKIAEFKESFDAFCTLKMLQSLSSWITAGVSFFNLAAISIDRLLALTLHLRYNAIVTVPRILQTSFVIWILMIALNALRIWMRNKWYSIPIVMGCLTFLVTTTSIFRIFQIVRRHQRQINDQAVAVSHPRANTVNKRRKSAVTVLYIYGLFIIFYLPFMVPLVMEVIIGFTRTVRITYDYAVTAIFINSCLNPLVYCWRISEIRRAVKNILKKE